MNSLKNSFTVFYYAFRLNDGIDLHNYTSESDSIWTPSELEPEKNYFFNHVQDFFTKNKGTGNNPKDTSCCVLFELKKHELTESQKEKLFLITQLFSRSLIMKDSKDSNVNFKFISDNSILAPRLFYHPLTRIGILSYTAALQPDCNTLNNLEELNYSMRTFGNYSDAIYYIARNTHPKAQEQENKISSKLSAWMNRDKEQGIRDKAGLTPITPDVFHSWNLNCFISLLLQDFPSNVYKSLSPRRMQAFVYAQTENRMAEDDLQIASFRLRRIYNSQFTPGKEFLKNTKESYQSFDQINLGASIEGVAIILNEDYSVLPEFLKHFDVVLRNRFIWTYLLAYFQRLALIDINNRLSSLYDEGQPDKDDLIQELADLSKIELRSFFEQVSYFSQHNEFYIFITENLKLTVMLKDVKEKLQDIHRIIDQQQSEAEKVKEKKREKKDRLLEIMIAALLFPELVYHYLSALNEAFDIRFPAKDDKVLNYAILIFCNVILLLVLPVVIGIYSEYFKVARAFFKKESRDD